MSSIWSSVTGSVLQQQVHLTGIMRSVLALQPKVALWLESAAIKRKIKPHLVSSACVNLSML